MVSPVTDIAEEITIFMTRQTTVLTRLALLTLPTSTNSFRDLDVGAAVEVVLAAGGAVEEVAQLGRWDLGNLANLPLFAGVVQVGSGACKSCNRLIRLNRDHCQ